MHSRKHPYYLNGRLLYLVLSQISLAAFYALRNIMMDRLSVKWTGLMSVVSATYLSMRLMLIRK
jgi:nucleoporin NDC1